MSDAKSKAAKAITKLSGQGGGAASSVSTATISDRRGGHVRDLNGTVHN